MQNLVLKCGFLVLLLGGPARGQVPRLVADINKVAVGGGAEQFLTLGDVTLFVARDLLNGEELWVTDGTEVGTHLLKDIRPGGDSSRIGLGVLWNGRAFFGADDGVHGRELWTSDGTEDGTHLVRDLVPGDGLFFSSFVGVPLDSFLVFLADSNGPANLAIWRTDGTEAGTQQVTALSVIGIGEVEMTELNGRAYFVVFESGFGLTVWSTDGTPGGIRLLRPSGLEFRPSLRPRFSVLGDRICWVMIATTGTRQERIGCSDGTVAGTTLLQDLPGDEVGIDHLVSVADHLIFSYRSQPSSDLELWRSDMGGNAAAIGGVGGFETIDALVASGTQAFVVGTQSAGGVTVWRTDGLEGGTRQLAALEEVATGSRGRVLGLDDGRVAFVADDGVSGLEPWISDGTVVGTIMIADVSEGAGGSNPTGLGGGGGQIWFEASTVPEDRRLWRTDGAAGAVVSLGMLNPSATHDSFVREMVPFGDGWAFVADDGVHGAELWFSNGTEAGTYLAADILPGAGSGVLSPHVSVFGDRVFFAADDGVHGLEPWVSDLTLDGTMMLADMRPGVASSHPRSFTSVGDRIFFSLRDGLVVSDGTSDGTHQFLDQEGYGLTPIGDQLVFFRSDDGIWRTDGTASGTERIAEIEVPIPVYPFSHAEGWIAAANGTVYIAGVESGTDGEDLSLWASDGTASGTVRLHDFVGSPGVPVVVPDGIVFAADDGVHGIEPWKSDGSMAGTQLVRDIWPGMPSSGPRNLLAAGGQVYFQAHGPDLGNELWQTGGTGSTTRPVHDVMPGPDGSNPTPLAVIGGGRILFSAQQGGRDLYASGKTLNGSRRITDGTPEVLATSSTNVSIHGRQVAFRAGDKVRGAELWLLDTLCFFDDQPLWLHNGRFRVDGCWRRPDKSIGVASPMALTDETGGFSFFNPANLDLSVKIIDGRPSNGQWWFFFGSLTNVAGMVRVTDTETGGYRDFELAQGESKSFAATDGFPAEQPISAPLLPATPVPVPPLPVGGGCDAPVDLCVQQDRFRVAVHWQVGDNEGDGTGVRTADNSGHFWFFRPENLELLVKVHDGRPSNGHFWVFLGALSNVAYTVTVTDTLTGETKEYVNARGDYQSVVDTSAFQG